PSCVFAHALPLRPRPPPRSTPFPYTTLFRSLIQRHATHQALAQRLDDVLALLQGRHLEAEDGAAIFFGDRDVLRHHHRRRLRHQDRKSTRLNSSHQIISYAVFCLKKKKPKRT